jgi:hypothetical protein
MRAQVRKKWACIHALGQLGQRLRYCQHVLRLVRCYHQMEFTHASFQLLQAGINLHMLSDHHSAAAPARLGTLRPSLPPFKIFLKPRPRPVWKRKKMTRQSTSLQSTASNRAKLMLVGFARMKLGRQGKKKRDNKVKKNPAAAKRSRLTGLEPAIP